MRLPIFCAGLAILALGATAMRVLDKPASYGFLTGALTLGGALLICGLFSLRNRWHGIIGAGVIALLGASRGIENLAALPAMLLGGGAQAATTLLESAVALISILLLIGIVRALLAEKKRRLLADEHDA
jgi:hypothetical protein